MQEYRRGNFGIKSDQRGVLASGEQVRVYQEGMWDLLRKEINYSWTCGNGFEICGGYIEVIDKAGNVSKALVRTRVEQDKITGGPSSEIRYSSSTEPNDKGGGGGNNDGNTGSSSGTGGGNGNNAGMGSVGANDGGSMGGQSGSPGGNAQGCFVAGTLVLTENGLVDIKDVKIGEKVYSINEKTGQIELRQVEKVYQFEQVEIYNITVGEETIRVTRTHPIYVKSKGYIEVKDIKVGDVLITSEGEEHKIEQIEKEYARIKVYNISVEDNHTFFIGNNSYLVHNKSW